MDNQFEEEGWGSVTQDQSGETPCTVDGKALGLSQFKKDTNKKSTPYLCNLRLTYVHPAFLWFHHSLGDPDEGGAVDLGAFQDFVAWQIAEGTHGLVPVGTTGRKPHPDP